MSTEVSNHDILVALHAFSADMDKKFNGVHGDINGLKNDIADLQADVSELRSDVKDLKNITTDHTNRLDRLEKKDDLLIDILTEKHVISQVEKMRVQSI